MTIDGRLGRAVAREINRSAGLGVAVREFPTASGRSIITVYGAGARPLGRRAEPDAIVIGAYREKHRLGGQFLSGLEDEAVPFQSEDRRQWQPS
jgi:hypothetical protein